MYAEDAFKHQGKLSIAVANMGVVQKPNDKVVLKILLNKMLMIMVEYCFGRKFLKRQFQLSENYNVLIHSSTQKEQHQDSFSNMAVFLFKSCCTKRYCACLISMCFRRMLHHTCITCHNIHHISPFTTCCFS